MSFAYGCTYVISDLAHNSILKVVQDTDRTSNWPRNTHPVQPRLGGRLASCWSHECYFCWAVDIRFARGADVRRLSQ